MSEKLKPILNKVAKGQSLSISEAESAFNIIMSGDALESQIGALLMGLSVRGETVEEITGAVKSMRLNSTKINAPDEAIDIVGTGGDRSGTYNISTAAAIVTAGCGVPVAKHGNKALSSKAGTADVLSELGVKLDADIPIIEKSFLEAGIGFMMAPYFHPAMKFVGPSRVALGIPTLFNLLGPLSNPASVKRQSTGVYDKKWVEPMAHVLKNLGSESAWVVHGLDGLDELTTTGPSFVAELKGGKVTTFHIAPEDVGLKQVDHLALKGGDAKYNAVALRKLLAGELGAYRDIVLLNAASALYISGKAPNLQEGVAQAGNSIDSGKARSILVKLVEVSNSS